MGSQPACQHSVPMVMAVAERTRTIVKYSVTAERSGGWCPFSARSEPVAAAVPRIPAMVARAVRAVLGLKGRSHRAPVHRPASAAVGTR